MADDSPGVAVGLVRRDAPHTWIVTLDRDGEPRSLRAHAVIDADDVAWVSLDGETFRLEPATRVRTRRSSDAGWEIEAPMPATVTDVLVQVGAQVAKGDTLVLLDAMKMELPLRASSAGRVIAVHCTVGDRVAPGRTLVDLAPEPAS